MLALYLMMLEDEQDRKAFFDLYQAYYNTMMAVAKSYFPTEHHNAEDAVHESFLSIIENFQKISQLSSKELPGYIVTVVKNKSIDILRKQKRLVLTDDWAAFDSAKASASESGYNHLVSIIRTMPDTYRAVLEMRFVLEMDYRTIAKTLGITEGSVASRINRGRQLLVERLEEEGITS